MLSELEYYKCVAYAAVQSLREAYWQEALRKRVNAEAPYKWNDKLIGDFYDECDEEAEDKVIEDCDLSPYQLADFMEYENIDPYDDYVRLEMM